MSNTKNTRNIPIRLRNEIVEALKPIAKKEGETLGIPTYGFATFLTHLITTHPKTKKILKEAGLERASSGL